MNTVLRSDVLRDKTDLTKFLRDISTKYLPSHLRPAFKVSLHFMERLTIDRADNLSKRWVSEVVSELFRYRLCEFIYLIAVVEDRGRINVQYQGRTIGLVKHHNFERNFTTIMLTTCFTGVALNPTICNHVLTLDQEDKTNDQHD